ncbi:kinase-like protein [Aspergillus venezuelensis]
MGGENIIYRVRHFYSYCPPGVKQHIASGGSSYIGEVDETTVMKYPRSPGEEEDLERLGIEKQIREVLASPGHKRIIAMKGSTEDGTGLYLERAINGTVADYLLESGLPVPLLEKRISWCREATEAVVYVHSKNVLHCDIQPTNLLLDKGLHIKLTDFQGRHLAEDGTVLLDGWSGEPTRFSCPREDEFSANVKTDLFALGCNIYFMIMGHAIYPDIIDGDEGYHEKVQGRLERKEWPTDEHVLSAVTLKCWEHKYDSAEEVLRDVEAIENRILATAEPQN